MVFDQKPNALYAYVHLYLKVLFMDMDKLIENVCGFCLSRIIDMFHCSI